MLSTTSTTALQGAAHAPLSGLHTRQSRSTQQTAAGPRRRSTSAGLHSTTPAAQPASVAELLRSFVRCQHGFELGSIYLSHWVGSPMKAAALRTKVPVEISIVQHSSDWDADAYVSSQLSQMNPTGQHAARMPAVAASSTAQLSTAAAASRGSSVWSSSPAETDTITSGPLPAFATKYRAKGETRVTGLKRRDIPGYARGVFDTALQEQVGPAAFLLHLKPHSSDAPRHSAQPVSIAGQGFGLQVPPGRMPDVPCDVGVSMLRDKKQAQLTVLKPLVFSQMPGLSCPAALTVIVKDPQGFQPDDCFTARMYLNKQDTKYRIKVPSSHPLAAYAGRRISKMALTPDGQLTLYLAPAAAEAPAAAAPGSSIGPAAGAAAGGGAAVKRRR